MCVGTRHSFGEHVTGERLEARRNADQGWRERLPQVVDALLRRGFFIRCQGRRSGFRYGIGARLKFINLILSSEAVYGIQRLRTFCLSWLFVANLGQIEY